MAYVRVRPSWWLPESLATPESMYLDRRAMLKSMGIGALALGGIGGHTACAQEAADPESYWSEYPMKDVPLPAFERNPKFADAGREITSLEDSYNPVTFNNFYEFGFSKDAPAQNAKNFKIDPYTLEIDGLVEEPKKLDLDDIEKLGIEERVYRFRCVEAWSMTVPWLGVPLKKILEQVEIKPEAKYVAFQTHYDPEVMPGQREQSYAWPYREGLRLDEAMNELTMAVTGLYGKRLLPQSGTPMRIITPWKYGYKGAKSVVKMTLVAEQPPTLWNIAIPSEYKFYSNVDPEVPHPRWSQASEKLLGDIIKRVPTEWYNGYGEYVAQMYTEFPRTLY